MIGELVKWFILFFTSAKRSKAPFIFYTSPSEIPPGCFERGGRDGDDLRGFTRIFIEFRQQRFVVFRRTNQNRASDRSLRRA